MRAQQLVIKPVRVGDVWGQVQGHRILLANRAAQGGAQGGVAKATPTGRDMLVRADQIDPGYGPPKIAVLQGASCVIPGPQGKSPGTSTGVPLRPRSRARGSPLIQRRHRQHPVNGANHIGQRADHNMRHYARADLGGASSDPSGAGAGGHDPNQGKCSDCGQGERSAHLGVTEGGSRR